MLNNDSGPRNFWLGDSMVALDEHGNNATPVTNETIVTIGFRDQQGNPHHSVTRTSRSLNSAPGPSLEAIQLALNTYYAMLGMRVFAIQVVVEQTQVAWGRRARQNLRLVSSNRQLTANCDCGCGGVGCGGGI